MPEIRDGGPAFPSGDGEYGGGPNHAYGMSLRDWFAGQALAGIIAGPGAREGVPLREWFDAPEIAYQLADAMLAARSTNKDQSHAE